MQTQLVEAHKRLLLANEQLQMTEAELEKKFSATNAYKNMKQILTQKNKQIRDIRRKLQNYEPAEEEEEAADD